MRQLITRFFRFAANVFFRRIEVDGLENIPASGAVIFAVNHPNGLVDPLFLLCFAPRPVSFLAKAPLFRYPVIGWFARTFDSIPVYRKQDNTKGTNAETFGRAREILARDGAIAIFPEGTTHSDSRLRELKTGAARIALGASLPSMHVVPTGIYYTAKQTFRSSALVVFGPPLRVEPAAVGADGEPRPEPVEQLTDAIQQSLAQVTLQADSRNALELIAHAEDIFTAGERQELADEFEIRRRFVDGYHYLCERDPQRLQRLESQVRQLQSELHAAGLAPDGLAGGFEPGFIRTAAIVLILFPIAIVGTILNWPTYRLVGILARRFGSEDEMTATIKFLAALLLYPLTWIAIAAVVQWRFGWLPAVAALLLQPLLAWVALRVSEALDDVIGRARALFRRMFGKYAYLRLVARRQAIREEFAAIAKEM